VNKNSKQLLISISLTVLSLFIFVFLFVFPDLWCFQSTETKIQRLSTVFNEKNGNSHIDLFNYPNDIRIIEDVLYKQNGGNINGLITFNDKAARGIKFHLLLKFSASDINVIQWTKPVTTNLKGEYNIAIPYGFYEIVGWSVNVPNEIANHGNLIATDNHQNTRISKMFEEGDPLAESRITIKLSPSHNNTHGLDIKLVQIAK